MKDTFAIATEELREIEASAFRARLSLCREETGFARVYKNVKAHQFPEAVYKHAREAALLGLRTAKWQQRKGAKGVLWEFSHAFVGAAFRDDFDFFVKVGRLLSSGQLSPDETVQRGHRIGWLLVDNWTRSFEEIPALCRLKDDALARFCQLALGNERITAEQVRKIRQRLGLIPLRQGRVNFRVVGDNLVFD